jgi:hypothetical protein
MFRIFSDDMLGNDNNSNDNLGLRSLEISGNNIKDSFAETLRYYLEVNNVIQFLDIGFNELTNEGLRDVKETLRVLGSTAALKKYNELSINLIGNPCDPYFLEAPNQSRAKATMNFSTSNTKSLAHIPISSRGQFVQRMDMQQKLNIRDVFPRKNYIA